MSTTVTKPEWADSKQDWLARVHQAELPSGIKVTYRDLTLGEMTALGELPSELLELAVAEWAEPGAAAKLAAAPLQALPEKPTKKQQAAAEEESRRIARNIAALNRRMIAAALVEPKLSSEELEQVPMADLELLSALINRQTAYDAAGRRVGVAPIDGFRIVLAAHGVEPCPAGCTACQEARLGLSTAR